MKSFLALAVLASSTVALASSRDIFDIMYLPSAGTSYGFSELDMANGKREVKNGGDTDVSGYRLTQTIGHAISDRFSLQAAMNYANVDVDPAGGSKTTTSGFSDPTVSARFRAMDEDFRLDFIGGALISVMDAEEESDGDKNNLRGGHALFVGAQMGNKTENFQWSVLGQLTHNLDSTIDRDGRSDIDVDSNDELLLRGDILNKLAEKSFLRSFASLKLATLVEAENTTYAAPATTYNIGTEYQHLMSKDLMLRGGVDYATTNQDSGIYDSMTAWNFRVAANYQF
jgi:hypothetical protein